MVHFAEINQAPSPYSMLQHIGRVATPKLVPINCLRYLQTTLIIGGRRIGLRIYVSAFIPNLPNYEQKVPPSWIVLDVWFLLSFISVDVLLAKTFLILVVCLDVRNNLCGNSSSSKFFLFNLNIAPVLFFLLQILICLIVYLLV